MSSDISDEVRREYPSQSHSYGESSLYRLHDACSGEIVGKWRKLKDARDALNHKGSGFITKVTSRTVMTIDYDWVQGKG